MGYNLQRMGEQYPWSPQWHCLYDKEFNGNCVQLSTIPTQSSNVLFSEKTAGKDATQMSYFGILMVLIFWTKCYNSKRLVDYKIM